MEEGQGYPPATGRQMGFGDMELEEQGGVEERWPGFRDLEAEGRKSSFPRTKVFPLWAQTGGQYFYVCVCGIK